MGIFSHVAFIFSPLGTLPMLIAALLCSYWYNQSHVQSCLSVNQRLAILHHHIRHQVRLASIWSYRTPKGTVFALSLCHVALWTSKTLNTSLKGRGVTHRNYTDIDSYRIWTDSFRTWAVFLWLWSCIWLAKSWSWERGISKVVQVGKALIISVCILKLTRAFIVVENRKGNFLYLSRNVYFWRSSNKC